MVATCACGQAAIEVNAEPTMHGVCHCTNCKRRTGSAFGIGVYFDAHCVEILRGALTAYEDAAVVEQRGATSIYAFHHAAQNHDQERHFCPRCGTTLFWYVSALPEKIGIAGGCFAGEGLAQPDYSVADRNREPWVSLPEGWSVDAG